MTLADFAVITIVPQHVLDSVWAHDTAHVFVAAKRRAILEKQEKFH